MQLEHFRFKRLFAITLLALVVIAAIPLLIALRASSNGDSLARQACGYVTSSITLYESSLKDKNQVQAQNLQSDAYDNLQLGLQPAAIATGDNARWQALMTTISESAEIPEGVLVNALSQQCALVDSLTTS